MALLKWDDEEDKKKDDLFGVPQIKTVSSVQNSWQPTQASTDAADQPQGGNYLFSEQKAQVDADKQRQDAIEEANRREAARQAEIARQEANARAAAAQEAQVVQPEATNVPAAKPKYGGGEKKNEGGFTGFLKNVGAGLQQGIGALGDIVAEGGGVVDYVGNRVRGMDDAQAAQRAMANTESVRQWLHSNKDINGNNIIGTRDVDANAAKIASGQGDIRDFAAVGGKGLQAGIDATMFANPARLAAGGLTPVVSQSAKLLPRIVTNPAVQYAARDAAFYGALQGGATTASQYGETGDLQKSLESGLQDAVVGGLLQGTLDVGTHATRKGIESLIPVANKTINSLRPGKELPLVENAGDLIGEGVQTPAQRLQQAEDGIVSTSQDAPLPTDGNITFEKQLDNSELGGQPTLLDNAQNAPTELPTNVSPVADGVATTPEVSADIPNNVTPQVDAPKIEPENVDVTPVTSEVAPVADGVVQPSKVMPAVADPNMPVVKGEQLRQLQDAKAGASQADEAQINQQVQDIQNQTPAITAENSLPDGMGDVTPVKEGDIPTDTSGIADRIFTGTDAAKETKQNIARSLGLEKDVESDVPTLLQSTDVKLGNGERKAISEKYAKLEAYDTELKQIMRQQADKYKEGGAAALDTDNLSRRANSLTDKIGRLQRDLSGYTRRLDGRKSIGNRIANSVESITGSVNANRLTGAGLIEKNLAQEVGASIIDGLQNPVKALKGSVNYPKELARSFIRAGRELTVKPKTVSEVFPYLIGNTYRTLMSPVTAAANVRKGIYRKDLAESLLRMDGKTPTRKEIDNLSKSMGVDSEVVANNLAGILNGMTSRGQGLEVMKAYQQFIKTGDAAAKAKFMDTSERSASLASQMTQQAIKDDNPAKRVGAAMFNIVMPFTNTAINLAKTAVSYNLNPAAKSISDEVLAGVRSGKQNLAATVKSAAVRYGVLGTAYAMYEAGVVGYNDGDDVSKPQGVYIDLGDNKYITARATPIELPLAAVVASGEASKDIFAGKNPDIGKYFDIISASLPYVSSTENLATAGKSLIDSAREGDVTNGTGDGGYAAKAYGVGLAKSFIPFSNNGIQPYVAGKNGESLNAKSVYDKDLPTWFNQSVRASYEPAFRNSLKDSRDAAGRVRTVDNQGVVVNKNINDANTKEFNSQVTELVKYGRENGLGKNTQDMFNTYDTGKNNNFKSVQDTITFLDAPDGKPDNTKKLEKNAKLTDLSRQIKDGFYGQTGSDLLTLDGKNLYSDVSVPNKDGTKNSKLPLNMQSIKNAVAQTDLAQADRDTMYAVSQKNDELYAQFKAKSISYDQYNAAKQDNEKTYVDILSKSENYKKLTGLMNELDGNGFFEADGMGSTRSGQTYLWNSLNALLGSKGATPAANFPDTSKGFTPFGRKGGSGSGSGFGATNKPGDRGNEGLKWTPVQQRQMASVASGKYTPVSIKVKLGNAIKKDKSQNYSDRSI